MNRSIRVGLIGYGFVGSVVHKPLIEATPGFELRVVATRPEDVKMPLPPGVDVVPTAEDLLAREDIDLVVIAAPNHLHAPLAIAALERGRHVVVEKPFALDVSEAKEMIEAAQRNNRILCAFQNRRWDSDFLSVQRALEENQIGRVLSFESRIEYFQQVVPNRWRDGARKAGGGIWYDVGPHMVDQALLLFGRPEAVMASFAALRAGSAVDDWAQVILIYSNMRVVLVGSMIAAGGQRRFVVQGEQGTLIKTGDDPQERRLKQGIAPSAPGFGDDPDPLVVVRPDGVSATVTAMPGHQITFYNKLRLALAGERDTPVTLQQTLDVTRVIEAGHVSAESGKLVVLEDWS